MRTTENLSLRLDPEVIRLARRTAAERRATLREFLEEALRRHVAAVTVPEERANLLSAVEEAFLRRLDERLRDVLERITVLSAKEAIDQAFTVQLLKRVLMAQIGDAKYKDSEERAREEAVARVQKRGRPTAPEVAETLRNKIKEWETFAAGQKARADKLQAEQTTTTSQLAEVQRQLADRDAQAVRLRDQVRDLEGQLGLERWVIERLDKQGLNPIGRRTAAELRHAYTQEAPQRKTGLF